MIDVPCRHCASSLRGLTSKQCCPECGTPVTDSLRGDPRWYLEPTPVQPADLLDVHGDIQVDVPCRRCGYNLRGLSETGRCPECATPVGLSCHGDLLKYAAPEWLVKLASGAGFILWGTLIEMPVSFIGDAAGALGLSSPGAQGGVDIVGGLLSFYGTWLITKPDPSGIGEDRYVTDRRVVRATLLATLVFQVLGLAALESSWPALLSRACSLMELVTELVGAFAILLYLQKLALRIPALALARRARALRWVLGICFCAALLGGALDAAGVTLPTAWICVRLPFGLGLLIGGVLMLVLIYRLRKAFLEQARAARLIWYTTQPAPPAR